MGIKANPLTRDWEDEVAEVAVGEMNAVIDILDPSGTGTPYDPSTDTGGLSEPATIITGRPARIQTRREPHTMDAQVVWTTQRRVLIQIELRPDDPIVSKGFVVRVTDGGRDPSLTRYAFEVLNAVNSSHAAVRTIQAIGDLAVLP